VRVVLDSNVLISARLEPRGPSAKLLEAWADDEFDLIVSPQLLEELRGVLGRDRLRRWLTEEEAELFVQSLRDNATIIDDPPLERGITRDPDDDFVVALARVAEADYVVSGDRHLLELVDQRPPVLTPRALLDLLIRERGTMNP
jgi:putative PIN family toxin of toxin-antitoxin system